MILSLLLLIVVTSLAAAMLDVSGLSLVASDTLEQIHGARIEAESGLSFLTYMIRQHQPEQLGQGEAMLDALAAALGEALNGSGHLAGAGVQYDGTTITIPAISQGLAGRDFSARISLVDDDTIQMRVTGRDGDITRTIGVHFGAEVNGSSASVFDYGIASRGPIRLTGNASVLGQNTAKEADILSAVYGESQAVDLTGNCEIEGDVHASDPDTKVKLTGNVQVGGERVIGNVTLPDPDVDEAIADHVHVGVGDVDFPEVDPTPFESYATTVVDASTNTSGNKTFTNIRIKANSNKTFSGNVELKGVIFIEQPNRIHFSGNVTITGVIVTEDAGENNYTSNTVKFSGNLDARGVEELPDAYPFAELRQKTGSFILAPGFGVEFVGNFGTIGGCMAAEKFKWTGNASGVVRGSVISYSDAEFRMTGNSRITIDRDGEDGPPAGFGGQAAQLILVLQPDSYIEF